MKLADMCGGFGNDVQLVGGDGRGRPFQFLLRHGQRGRKDRTVKMTGQFDDGFIAPGGDIGQNGARLRFHRVAGIMPSGKGAEELEGRGIVGGLYFEQAAGHG